ncbi:MAG: AmmeMemoRadiSam system protein B [Candidatus Krumholzibacteriia bacterium]
MTAVRPPVLAGSWYPGDPVVLAREVDRCLALADPALRPSGRPLIAVVPHAGYAYSAATAGKAYGLLRDSRWNRVFLLAPNHRVAIDRIALSGAGAFATPLGSLPVDTAAVRALASCPAFTVDDRAHADEHAVEIQLPFLQRLRPEAPPSLVPMLVPRLGEDRRREAAAALRAVLGKDDLLLVSTDFTHYGASFGYVPFRRDVPEQIERLDAGAILKILGNEPTGLVEYGAGTGITMCGLEAAALALACGLPPGYEAALLDYARSADRDGDYSLSVSYAALLICSGAGSPPEGPAHE